MRFSTDFIEKVREASNIVEIVGQYVEFQKSGSNHKGLCPFPGHAEKTPSFFVSDSKQLYNCFGCGKGGTIFNFLMEYQGLSFPEAVEYLANRAHIPMPLPSDDVDQDKFKKDSDEKKTFLKLNKFAAAFFLKKLENQTVSERAKSYLTVRNISDETLKEFKLGYAPMSWNELSDYLQKSQAPLPAAEKVGLIKKKAENKYYDMFRDRIMFPILSATGEVIGFGGRIIGEDNPKYLNSPESPVFHKGRTLFGLFQAAKYIRSQDMAIVVEGYMDLLALHQNGIKNVVATLGTALTADHARLLKRTCSHVLVLFDSDPAGVAAAKRSLPIFLESGLFSKCLSLPSGKDPDEYLQKHGKEAFLGEIAKAPDHFMWFLTQEMASYRASPAEKFRILGQLETVFKVISDPRIRTIYMMEVSKRLDLDLKRLEAQFSIKPQHTEITKESRSKPFVSGSQKEEKILVQFMLRGREYCDEVRASEVINHFENENVKKVAEAIVEKYCQNPNDFDKLAAYLLNEGYPSDLLTQHVGQDVISQEGEEGKRGEKQLFLDCLNRVKDRHLKTKSRQLINSLKSEIDTSSEKLSAFMEIARRQKGPRGPEKSGT